MKSDEMYFILLRAILTMIICSYSVDLVKASGGLREASGDQLQNIPKFQSPAIRRRRPHDIEKVDLMPRKPRVAQDTAASEAPSETPPAPPAPPDTPQQTDAGGEATVEPPIDGETTSAKPSKPLHPATIIYIIVGALLVVVILIAAAIVLVVVRRTRRRRAAATQSRMSQLSTQRGSQQSRQTLGRSTQQGASRLTQQGASRLTGRSTAGASALKNTTGTIVGGKKAYL